VVRLKFGKEVRASVSKQLVEKTYPEALKEKGFRAVALPEIGMTDIEENAPFTYSATVEVMPRLDVLGYKDIKVERTAVEVTEKEIADNLEHLRESHAQYTPAEKNASEGDMVAVDFYATVEGKRFEKWKAADYHYIIGAGTAAFPEFEDSVKGAKAGASLQFKKPFPSGYHEKHVAGKEVEFHLEVKWVKEKKLPPLDDDFARDLGAKDLGELRERVAAEIRKFKEKRELERRRNVFIDQLIEKNLFTAPESIVNRHYARVVGNLLENVRLGLVDPREANLSSEEVKERYRAVAVRQAKGELLLNCVAEKENIEVAEKDYEKALAELAGGKSISMEAIRERVEKEGVADVLKDGIKREKVFETFLEEKAN
jgi:trigger factor